MIQTSEKFKRHLMALCTSPKFDKTEKTPLGAITRHGALSKNLVKAFLATHDCGPEFSTSIELDTLPDETIQYQKEVLQFFHYWHSCAYCDWKTAGILALKDNDDESKTFLHNLGYIQYEYRNYKQAVIEKLQGNNK